MSNNTQLERYKKLLAFIDDHLNEDISIETVEDVCHYSYRNINRIFEAIHRETIGKYVKRLRLEKAAQYLKYSEMGVSQIAYMVGFEDRSAFSKAFKKMYDTSPQTYRDSSEITFEALQQSLLSQKDEDRTKLQYEIEILPDFEYLFLEYRGSHEDIDAIEKEWELLFNYAEENKLVSDQSIFMTEIVDDAEISDHIHSRYNQAIILEKPLGFEPQGLFRIRVHKQQKYAKFTHKGTHESCAKFYQEIFAFWMEDVGLELVDRPLLEFYDNFDEGLPESQLITEIYVPVSQVVQK